MKAAHCRGGDVRIQSTKELDVSEQEQDKTNVLKQAIEAFNAAFQQHAPAGDIAANKILEAPWLRQALFEAVEVALTTHEGNLPYLLGQLARQEHDIKVAQAKIRWLTEALEEVVSHFAHVSDGGMRHTGGVEALERGFSVLGWDDPHRFDASVDEIAEGVTA